MLTSIITFAAPFAVTAITGLLKKLPAFDSLSDASRTPAVRFLAAAVSLVYIVIGLWVSPATLDPHVFVAAIEVVGLTFYAWISSLGLFHGLFQKAQ